MGMMTLFASLPPAKKRHTSALKSGGSVAAAAVATTGPLPGLATAPIKRSWERADNMPVTPTAAQHWPINLRREGSEGLVGGFIGKDYGWMAPSGEVTAR